MTLSDIYLKIYNYLATVVFINNDIKIIYAMQNAPVPSNSFITISISNIAQHGTGILKNITDEGISKLYLGKRFNVTFKAFANFLHESVDILNRLQNSFYTQEYLDFFQSDIAYCRDLTKVQVLSSNMQSRNDSIAVYETEFSTTQELTTNVGLIKTVNINNETINELITINGI